MKIGCLALCCFVCLFANAQVKSSGKEKSSKGHRENAVVILPSTYGIQNNGTYISQEKLNAWLTACKRNNGLVYFPAGKYLLPSDFEFDFGNNNLSITGDGPGKTILTTYNGPATNFAIPEKINCTRAMPAKDGIYQVDIIGAFLHRDYKQLTGLLLDEYVQVENGKVNRISFDSVKALGYVTELDATATDPGADGLYVVAKHAVHYYGGGFQQLVLGYKGAPLYLQGTVLQRRQGIWSRFYSSVAFIAQGEFSVKNISFRNFMPYLFLPAVKKGRISTKTNNRFLVDNCRFEHTARVLASMAYGGMDQTDNWYKASGYYPVDWKYLFNQFSITDSEFSYIHESIVWGTPPAKVYKVSNNNIHDCYTMINCIYLFPMYNTSMPTANRCRFTVTNNTFTRIRVLNPGSENTVHLIRTMNSGLVANNVIIDCTGIHLYLNGASTIRNNLVKTFMHSISINQARPPVILIKIAQDERITVADNSISMGMMGNLIANESMASVAVTNNTLIGACSRFITSKKDKHRKLDIYRTYTILDTAVFFRLTGVGNYDTAIRVSNTVYYNKRKSRWEALTQLPQMYLYSEVDVFNKSKQTVVFKKNIIEASYLTRIQKKVFTDFDSVVFENNNIRYTVGMHAGNDSAYINEYRFVGNTVRNGGLSIIGLGNPSRFIRSLYISGNTFYADFLHSNSFTASEKLVISNNTFTPNEAYKFETATAYPSFGLTTIPAVVNAVTLTGYPGQQMMISENRFIAEMTRGTVLQINEPYQVSIAANSFNLAIPAWQAAPLNNRSAISFNAPGDVLNIKITGNRYYPQTGKDNSLVVFDTGASTIQNFTNENNQVIINEQSVKKTVSASHKKIMNYYNRKNLFEEKESVLTVENKIVK